jgi:hypothetical protein
MTSEMIAPPDRHLGPHTVDTQAAASTRARRAQHVAEPAHRRSACPRSRSHAELQHSDDVMILEITSPGSQDGKAEAPA